MGIGDWGLGIGDWGLGPIPNPQSPIPNPQSPLNSNIFNIYLKKIFINIINQENYLIIYRYFNIKITYNCKKLVYKLNL